MLLDLLEPEEAARLGPDVLRQFRVRRAQKAFFRKLRRFHEVTAGEASGSASAAHSRVLQEISRALVDPGLDPAGLRAMGPSVASGCRNISPCGSAGTSPWVGRSE